MKKLICYVAMVSCFLFLLIPRAEAIIWSGDYLQVGVNDAGGLLDNSLTVGIKLDPSGTGSYGAADFLLPGNPFEFYSLGVSPSTWNDAGFDGAAVLSNPFSATTVDVSSGTDFLALTYTGTFSLGGASLSYIQQVYFAKNSPIINFSVDILNKGDSPVAVVYARGLDPDQGVNVGEGYATINTIAGNTVTGMSTGSSKLYISIVDLEGSGVPGIAGPNGGAWDTNPFNLFMGPNLGNGDYSINMAWLMELPANTSNEIDFQYKVGQVPIPPSCFLVLSGLLPFIRLRRKRSIA
jgi:hypothetical protein